LADSVEKVEVSTRPKFFSAVGGIFQMWMRVAAVLIDNRSIVRPADTDAVRFGVKKASTSSSGRNNLRQ